MTSREPKTRSGVIEIVAGLVLIAALLGLRLWDLEADPPSDLAISSSVYTDGPSYTLYARSFVESGELNPFGDYRHPFFTESSVTALAIVVFEIFGTGFWQSNAVGVFYSLGSIVLLFFFVRRTGGRMAAWFFLAMIGLDYSLLFFGRMPFLEHAMQFWASLALVLVTYSNRPWCYFLAGLALAVGIFYGKIIGLIFLFPFACLLVCQALHERSDSKRGKWLPTLAFSIGLTAGVLVWIFVTYLPASTQVSGYLGEHTVGIYGAPEALQSVGNFLWAMVSFGVLSNLFPRMALVALVGVALILMVLYHVARRESWRDGFGRLGSGHVFVAASIIAFFGSLMIWNYRPLRYELALIYPFYAAAAMVLAMLWSKWRGAKNSRVTWPFYPSCFVIMIVVVAQVASGLADQLGWDFAWEDGKWLVMLVAVLITVGIAYAPRLLGAGKLQSLKTLSKALVILIMAIALGNSTAKYVEARQNGIYTLRDNSVDLSMLLADNAVLSGPFGPAMALIAERPAVIHMFGAPMVDATLFERFPITHLLMDRDNAGKAWIEYPEIMNKSRHVCTYHIGPADVSLFRIAGHTSNATANAYRPSLLEQAIEFRSRGDYPGATELAERFVLDHPENITANLLLGELADAVGDLARAERFVQSALRFSPTNHHLNAVMAGFYKDRYQATGDEKYKIEAVTYFGEALRLSSRPVNQDNMRTELQKLGADPDGD